MDDPGEQNRPFPIGTMIVVLAIAVSVILRAPLPEGSDNPQAERIIEVMRSVQDFLVVDQFAQPNR
jgi:hypothetical protein